ncbi:Pectinesterase, catalytic [Cynara cardunculus var. scolymus]|uniref:pectinesterase n=1 Tax=Cynara cardunculus var. scolymus TaxID=59895 RepID=A0A118JTH6_CYNCS|nr:Pectinesterase, catalytic [Cynara cardunculus var. scolymus]
MAILLTLLVLFLDFGRSQGGGGGRRPPSEYWSSGGATGAKYQTIVVDQSGRGNYTTIQAAIDAIPSDNMQWVCVYVKTGFYNEQIKIPSDKSMIYLKGDGKRKTYVVWNSNDSIETDATFTSEADDVVVKSISFINSYNYPLGSNDNPIAPALAAKISGDRSAFYRCGFMGVQDTLWDVSGRHYFKLCSIRGAVDFIMGSGRSIYERCTLSVIAGFLSPQPGFITAQSRDDASETNGFVFKDCNVIGNGTTYLGRPWRGHARVLFYNSTNDLMFAEDGCRGEGSDTSGRAGWVKRLSKEEVWKLTSMSYIDEEGWIKDQAFNMLPS